MAATKENRIKSIQQFLKIPQSGLFDSATCNAYATLKNLNIVGLQLPDQKKEIQRSLGFTGEAVDGDIGSNSLDRIEKELKITVSAITSPPSGVKMKTLIIGAGHGGSDPGASGNGYIERNLAIEFRDLLVAELQKLSVKCIIDDNVNALKASLVYFKQYFNPDSINIDIHWNASAKPEATGTEVLISTNASQFEKQLGGKIGTTIATTLGIKNRGLKTEQDSARSSLAWLHQTGYDFIIEMCFISNKTDMDKYQAKKIELSKEMAKVLFDAVKL